MSVVEGLRRRCDNAEPIGFAVREDCLWREGEAISIAETPDGPMMVMGSGGEEKRYLIRKLYIADGDLKHRDWFLNTNLGPVAYVVSE